MAFCLEESEELKVPNSHHLTLEMRAATAADTYNFLPSSTLVFSRTVTKYYRFKSSFILVYKRQVMS